MSTMTRVGLVIAALCVLGASLATFLPTSPQGATCGSWVAPEWTDEGVADLVDSSSTTAQAFGELGLDEQAGETAAIGHVAATSKRLCDDALSTRRTTSLVLLVLAVAVPTGIVFIADSRRREA